MASADLDSGSTISRNLGTDRTRKGEIKVVSTPAEQALWSSLDWDAPMLSLSH